jgi:hypothetical protein
MKFCWFLVFGLLAVSTSGISQVRKDSSFSLFVNSSLSYTHADDVHINRWLAKYGYPTIPRVPSSLNFEFAATPAYSRLLYSIRLSSINSANNLSSFNIMAGLYTAVIKKRSLLLFLGGATGLHRDIITLNGNIPPEYQQVAAQAHGQLALRRAGLCLEPGARLFWYPIHIGLLQIGVQGALGYDWDINSRWKLGYYTNNHGKYSHFKSLSKPNDQKKVSEYGLFYSAGISIRANLH